MIITIDDKVLAYLNKKKSSDITIGLRAAKAGWCGQILIPEVVLTAPGELTYYEKITLKGINIYIENASYKELDKLDLQLEKHLFITKIVPYGMDVKTLR